MTDTHKRFVYKGTKVIGETGKDTEASLGNGKWYAKHFGSEVDSVGFDTRKDAILEVECLEVLHGPPGTLVYNSEYERIARQAVAEVNQNINPRFAELIMAGIHDDHIELRVATKAVELALERLVKPEHVQTMLATGKDGDMVAKTKDGGLTWTYVPFEQHKAEVLGNKPLAATD